MSSAGSVLQVIGSAAVTVGASLLSAPAGWITGGVLAVLIGVGLERSRAE